MRKIVVAILALLPLLSVGQDKVTERIISLGKTDGKVMEHLDILANRIGGRPIGSDANLNATEWAKRTLESWGLEVEVEKVGELPVGFNRGPWFGRLIGDGAKTLRFATPTYSRGTRGIERGHVVMDPRDRAEFERIKGKLNGAWVMVRQEGTKTIDWSSKGDSVRLSIIAKNDSIGRAFRDSLRKSGNMAYPSRTPLKPSYIEVPALFYREMVEAGVRGFIRPSEVPIMIAYDRNIMTGALTWDNLPPVPEILMDVADYELISEKLERKEFFLLEFDIRNHFKPGPVPYYNVLAKIKGSKYPDEIVMAGAHLDSYDVATGGVDCGSGTALTMEAARLIVNALEGKRPLRTIMFCLWTGEEFGLLGSKYWVENHSDLLPKISNYFNRDGGPTVATSISVTEAMYPFFKPAADCIASIDARFPFQLSVRKGKPSPRPKNAGGSDHAYFAMNGVPTLQFTLSDPLGYDFQYTEIWHTDCDTYDKSIEPYQQHSAIATAVMLWNLANTKTILPREGLYSNDN